METVNVFIASSLELADWRMAIGCAFMQWSEEYEKYGIRLKMSCWEDYRPEFTGQRKQTEYNEDLIKKSQIFIALFWTRCGMYTQEEVRVALETKMPMDFILRQDVQDTKEIDTFLSSKKITPKFASSIPDMLDIIKCNINNYLSSHVFRANSHLELSKNGQLVYLTIPQDCLEEENIIKNSIRQIDYLCEEFFNDRCHLRQNDNTLICSSDYYLALLKDSLTNREQKEVITAIENTNKFNQLKQSALYEYRGAKFRQNNPAVSSLFKEVGIFTEEYVGPQLVKFNLLRWMIETHVTDVTEQAGINVSDGWVTFLGIKIIHLSQININDSDPSIQLSKLLLLLSSKMVAEKTEDVLSDEEFNEEEFNAAVISEQRHQCALEDQMSNSLERFVQLHNKLSNQINKLLADKMGKDHVVDIIRFLQKLIKIEKKLQESGKCQVRDVIKSMILIVKLHDTYSKEFESTRINIDLHYKSIVEYADSNNFIDLDVEIMRFNYGNYLARHNLNNDAIECYESSMKNMLSIDAHSRYLRLSLTHAFITCINHLINLGILDKAICYITQFEDSIATWSNLMDKKEITIIKVRLLASKLRMRPFHYPHETLIKSAENMIKLIINTQNINFGEKGADEVYIDFPNCYVAYLIDTVNINNYSFNLLRAQEIINYLIPTISSVTLLDKDYQLFYLGEVNHNFGRLFNLMPNDSQWFQPLTARKHFLTSERFRRDLLNISQDSTAKEALANTLFNIGTTYTNGKYKIVNPAEALEALKYIEESLQIYEKLNTEHHLEQETNVYKVKLLKATVLIISNLGKEREGLDLLQECKNWSDSHPDNSYKETFDGVYMSFL